MRGAMVFEALESDEVPKEKAKDFRGASSRGEEGQEQPQTAEEQLEQKESRITQWRMRAWGLAGRAFYLFHPRPPLRCERWPLYRAGAGTCCPTFARAASKTEPGRQLCPGLLHWVYWGAGGRHLIRYQ